MVELPNIEDLLDDEVPEGIVHQWVGRGLYALENHLLIVLLLQKDLDHPRSHLLLGVASHVLKYACSGQLGQ